MSLLEHNINIISIYRVDGRILQKTRMPQDPRDAWHADPWHSDTWHTDPVLQGHLTPIQLCVIPTQFNGEAVGALPPQELERGFPMCPWITLF